MGIEFSSYEEFMDICLELDPSQLGFVKFEAFYKYVMDGEESDEMLAELEAESMSKVITA